MSKFIISLDYELRWGVFNVFDERYDDNLLGARQVIPQILNLFKEHRIKATWAIVGLLFNSTKEEFYKNKPLLEPSYNVDANNPYLEEIGDSEEFDKIHYAESIVKMIHKFPGQEIGSHTYSHFNCKNKSHTRGEFESDIRSAVKVAKDKLNINMASFVFPKNEINLNYLAIIKKYNFTHYRGNPNNIIYSKGHNSKNITFRIIRLLDSYLNITGYQVSNVSSDHDMVNVIGNRMLRPFNQIILLNKLMLKRIKDEMLFAAKNNKNYHLWWHPHNFGINIEDNLNNLSEILDQYKYLNEHYGMCSATMSEI